MALSGGRSGGSSTKVLRRRVRVSGVPERLLSAKGREFLERLELPAGARERIDVAFAMVDAIDRQLAPIERELPHRGETASLGLA